MLPKMVNVCYDRGFSPHQTRISFGMRLTAIKPPLRPFLLLYMAL